MIAIRQELGLIAGLALAAFLASFFLGNDMVAFGGASAAYIGWHGLNLMRLLNWLRHPQDRTPISHGIWEQIFDSLQAIELRSRKQKRELFDLVRQLRLVIGGIADAVVLLDGHGRIRWFNPAAQQLLGLKRPEAAKKPIAEVVDHPFITDLSGTSGALRTLEMHSPVNGAIVLRIEISELAGTGQHLLFARDITKTHNLERSRKDFVANVSHELRTPLTVFRGYLEMLADASERLPELDGPVRQLNQQTSRMQSLVNDLLDLSRLELSDRLLCETPVDVPDMVSAIVDVARCVTEAESHEIVANIDPQLWLLGNAATLRMAFSNLVLNAVQHTREGTRISVRWCEIDGEPTFQVRDNGQGIVADHLSRLTERFYRVDAGRSRDSGGTGLGLAIAKHALERHDADLQIESTPGRGSTFTCRFPAAHVAQATVRTPSVTNRQVRNRDLVLH